MLRALPVALLLMLAAPAGAQAQPPLLSARLASCQIGPTLAERSASFTGSMPAIPGTRRMAVRFDLLQRRAADGRFVVVPVPGLGVWQRSLPGKPGFIFTQRVEALAAPGAYRAVVRFRWYARGGRLLRVARRETRICRQPELRPNLRAGQLTVGPAVLPDAVTYQLVVHNDGRSAAGPFDVVLTVNETPQPAQRLGGLDAHTRTVVSFIAARCEPGSSLRFALDAGGEVDERSEADDLVVVPCPLSRQLHSSDR